MAKNYTYPSCLKSHKGFRTPCVVNFTPPPLKSDNQLITGKNTEPSANVDSIGCIPLELSNPLDGLNHYPAELSNPFDGFNHYPAELSRGQDGLNHHPDRKQKTLWETQGIDCITHKTITV